MIDLHLHLDGSLDPRIIPTLAKMAGVTLPCEDANSIITKMTVSPDCTSLGEYLEKFELPLMLLQTAECLMFLQAPEDSARMCHRKMRFLQAA